MSPWLFNIYIYMDAMIKEVKMGMAKRVGRFLVEGESRDYLASCMQMTWFCVVSGRKT